MWSRVPFALILTRANKDSKTSKRISEPATSRRKESVMTQPQAQVVVELSVKPSAIRLPEDFNLGGAFGSRGADRVAAVIIVCGQARGRDSWEAVPRNALPSAITALVGEVEGPGAAILTLFESPYEVLGDVRDMVEAGYLSFGVGEIGGTSVATVSPTEEFIRALAPYRV